MAENIARGTYVQFHTKEYFDELADEKFSEKKFKEEYENNPLRLSREQLALTNGHDVVYDTLRTKFIEEKYAFKTEKLFNETKFVLLTMADVIKEQFPNLYVTCLYAPKADPKILVKSKDGVESISISATLNDTDDNYFSIHYYTTYSNAQSLLCSDLELLTEIGKLNYYIESHIKPSELVSKVSNECENQYVLTYDNQSIHLYDVEMIQLYHTLAKDANERLGLKFPYSQRMIDKMWKHDVFGNIQYVGKFYLVGSRSRGYDLEQTYFYEDDSTKQPNFKCCATYGSISESQIISLLTTLQPYATSNYFAETSKKELGKKYDFYDKIGIGYDKKPNYFQDLEYVK